MDFITFSSESVIAKSFFKFKKLIGLESVASVATMLKRPEEYGKIQTKEGYFNLLGLMGPNVLRTQNDPIEAADKHNIPEGTETIYAGILKNMEKYYKEISFPSTMKKIISKTQCEECQNKCDIETHYAVYGKEKWLYYSNRSAVNYDINKRAIFKLFKPKSKNVRLDYLLPQYTTRAFRPFKYKPHCYEKAYLRENTGIQCILSSNQKFSWKNYSAEYYSKHKYSGMFDNEAIDKWTTSMRCRLNWEDRLDKMTGKESGNDVVLPEDIIKRINELLEKEAIEDMKDRRREIKQELRAWDR